MAVIASLAQALRPLAVGVKPLAGRMETIVRALRNRRAVGRLTELDAHQLKDIGLTRGQVIGALQAPLLKDPSALLVDIAGRGSVRRRAAVRTEVSMGLTPREI